MGNQIAIPFQFHKKKSLVGTGDFFYTCNFQCDLFIDCNFLSVNLAAF